MRRGMVHRDGDDSAQRQAADVGALDLQRVHRGEDGGGEIVVVGLAVRRIAFAIARIIEGDGVARAAEMIELRPPHRFVRADAVEEDDRRRRDLILGQLDAAKLLDADRALCCRYPSHPLMMP